MKQIKIAGRNVLTIGLGTWHMGDDPKQETREIAAIKAGLDHGVQVIDTAEMYGEGNSERLVGKAIATYPREALFLISKVYPWNASKKQLPQSLEASLRRLDTDYLDLYLLHWTGNIPIDETVFAMEEARTSGKIRAWGVSNFDVANLEELYALPTGKNCQANEVLYNLGERGTEFDLQPYMKEKKLPLIAYSPLNQADRHHDLIESELIQRLAKNHQVTPYQILLTWTIRQDGVLAIPQSSDVSHTLANVEAAEIELTKAELDQLDKVFPAPTKKQGLAMI